MNDSYENYDLENGVDAIKIRYYICSLILVYNNPSCGILSK